ncbi:MAG: putative hydrolase or acyltransferase of alpha/beta superfamily [Microbacteriaceae bacterium]|jgi:pimeloyl-ACP methyl ester carboxylesterase|nr:putative hydrolase or acyltransferase of alpha/beta superfamily [Microbacteriaceae bacterium]
MREARGKNRAGAHLQDFGSAVVDEAARLDSELLDLDWTVHPEGSVTSVVDAPSGPLAMVSLGDPAHRWVLLVPGVTGSKEDFALMMPGLAAAGYYVQSYDIAGQYESTAAGPERLVTPRGRYDYELFVDDMVAILERAPGPAHVLGYSFAGTVAQLAMVRRPELFASLTLLSCPPQPGQGFRGVKRIGWFSGLATGRIGAALMIWGLRRNFTRVPPGRLAFVKHRLGITRVAAVEDIIRLMKRAPDCRQQLEASTIPKLVAVGEHDLWPLALHSTFATEIGAKLAVYRTGHSPCETSPHQLNRDLIELYSRSA